MATTGHYPCLGKLDFAADTSIPSHGRQKLSTKSDTTVFSRSPKTNKGPATKGEGSSMLRPGGQSQSIDTTRACNGR